MVGSPKHAMLVSAVFGLLAGQASAAPPPPLKLPSFDALSGKASQSVTITLDSGLLGLAASFLDPAKPDDAAAKEIIKGISGIYVRSYSFDGAFVYPRAEVDAVRKQLSAPGWQHLVEVKSTREQANVDVYMSVEQGHANGMAIITSQPREFTIVNIVGSIDLQKLHRLEGKFGIPKLQLQEKKQP